jgi:hypothetical protein
MLSVVFAISVLLAMGTISRVPGKDREIYPCLKRGYMCSGATQLDGFIIS